MCPMDTAASRANSILAAQDPHRHWRHLSRPNVSATFVRPPADRTRPRLAILPVFAICASLVRFPARAPGGIRQRRRKRVRLGVKLCPLPLRGSRQSNCRRARYFSGWIALWLPLCGGLCIVYRESSPCLLTAEARLTGLLRLKRTFARVPATRFRLSGVTWHPAIASNKKE